MELLKFKAGGLYDQVFRPGMKDNDEYRQIQISPTFLFSEFQISHKVLVFGNTMELFGPSLDQNLWFLHHLFLM